MLLSVENRNHLFRSKSENFNDKTMEHDRTWSEEQKNKSENHLSRYFSMNATELFHESSATKTLITQAIAVTSGYLGLPLRIPPHLGPVEAPPSDLEDAPLDYIGSTNSVGLGIRSAPSTPMAPLQGQTDTNHSTYGHSVVNLNTISRSPSHISSKSDSKSIKQLSTSAPVAANINQRSISPHQRGQVLTKNESSEKEKDSKEKKRKELSSSRQKKFHRHFPQVSNDERVLNYFSCALVSDILLQGHLYITDNYFAFYSNVFGFVTKLLIPIVSVVKISKEKTAKIIPNAVGVATIDERHVFGSFMSREAAYRLMLSVWRPVAPAEPETPVTKIPDVEISEYSVEDDSSCSISGNESPPHVQDSSMDTSESAKQQSTSVVDGSSSRQTKNDESLSSINSQKLVSDLHPILKATSVVGSSQQSSNIATAPTTTEKLKQFRLKIPTDFHIVYVGVVLAIILALFSGFLLYRIIDIQARTNGYTPNDFQNDIQFKSIEEMETILKTKLDEIVKVHKILEEWLYDKSNPDSSDQFDETNFGQGNT